MSRGHAGWGTTGASEAATGAEADLMRLAEHVGILTEYRDGTGTDRAVPAETVVKVLAALGHDVAEVDDASSALDALAVSLRAPRLDPVIVAWDGRGGVARLQGVGESPPARLRLTLRLEDGRERLFDAPTRDLTIEPIDLPDGSVRRDLHVPVPELPLGRHVLRVLVEGEAWHALILAAPLRAPAWTGPRTWGLFAPLYGLRTSPESPAGDFTTLQAFVAKVRELGGGVAASLPLLPLFLQDRLHDPSPYAPVSRRFWNEVYVDPTVEPEFDHPDVQRVVRREGATAERVRLARSERVDLGAVWRWRRPVFDAMAAALDGTPGRRRDAWHAWRSERPEVESYARFRAAAEAQDSGWPVWEDVDAALAAADEAHVQTYAYLQWVAAAQMQRLATHARARGVRLALDLPLGVHADSFDAWRDRSFYAAGMSLGAPPDGFFIRGQDWGFAPYHPGRLRAAGYGPLLAAVGHSMAQAGILRIDHLMGMHRQFWIPHGRPATEGAYVRQHAEEIYALLLVEAHRHGVALHGEDLGTVPPEVPPAMARHGLLRSYVFQLEAAFSDGWPKPPGDEVIAAVNTHDMPLFRAFWTGSDVDERMRQGLLDEAEGARERQARSGLRERLQRPWDGAEDGEGTGDASAAGDASGDDAAAAYRRVVRFLAAGGAPVVLLDLVDVFGGTAPHNRPGTSGAEAGNWTRRVPRALSDVDAALFADLGGRRGARVPQVPGASR